MQRCKACYLTRYQVVQSYHIRTIVLQYIQHFTIFQPIFMLSHVRVLYGYLPRFLFAAALVVAFFAGLFGALVRARGASAGGVVGAGPPLICLRRAAYCFRTVSGCFSSA